jgi:pimeloyl-ACP methyl ester carboxylesterase
MRFLHFGNKENPAMLLIHGFGTTWRMWSESIETFVKDYYVVVAILDGMDDENTSEFHSVEKTSTEIVRYVQNQFDGKIYALIGASLGGTIALDILSTNLLEIKKAIIDGAPIVPMHSLYVKFAIAFSKFRSRKIAERNWITMRILRRYLTEENLEEVIKTADFINDRTIDRVMTSTFTYSIQKSISQSKVQLAYWYGSKEKATLNKSLKKIKEILPNAQIKEFKGYDHGELCLKDNKKYVKEVLKCIILHN